MRSQAGAIAGALLWLYAVEQLLAIVPVVGDEVRRLGLAGLSSGLSGTPSPVPDAALLGQVPAGLVLGGYALIVLAAGALSLRRRDIGG